MNPSYTFEFRATMEDASEEVEIRKDIPFSQDHFYDFSFEKEKKVKRVRVSIVPLDDRK